MSQTNIFKDIKPKIIPVQRRRIALVDEDIDYGRLVSEAIKDYHVSFSHFNSLMKFAREQPISYDIILVDYQMKSMDGVQAAEYLRKIVPKIPILLISGGLLDEHIDSWPQNLKAFLPKHIGPSQLVTRVMELLEQVLEEDLS